MRAISALKVEAGITTSSCAAWMPLRMRVRKSAMGSVIDMALPARLRHAGDEALMRKLAQADAAQPELAVDRARAPATPAAAVRPRGVLRLAVGPHDHGCLCHLLLFMRRPAHPRATRSPPGARRGRTACRARRGGRRPPRRSARSS